MEFDPVYITRYAVAGQVLRPIAQFARQAKTVINVADLHFLRSIRGAIAERSDAKIEDALELRDAELAVLSRADLVLSYSSVEQVVITSHLPRGPKTGIVPWVIDTAPITVPFAKRKDIAFVGGFRHAPNVAAVRYFADEVMPLLRKALPGVRFLVYGSHMPPEIEALDSEDVVIKGYVADVAEVFSSCRIFVAPLLSGAGMKGKVLDCMAAGIPSVLSSIATEGIGLREGVDAIIANRPEEWVDGISRLYRDDKAWNAMSKSVQDLAASRYSFKAGVETLQDALAAIDFFVPGGRSALHANSARPVAPAAARLTHEAKEFTGAVSSTHKGSP
jgi:glycosyltransferase involved in cell wall biosynthesis